MIIKVSSRKEPSFRQLIKYILKDEKSIAEPDQGILLQHNLKGDTVDEWVKEYIDNETYRQHNRTGVTILSHEIIAFKNVTNENITNEMLKTFTEHYIQLRSPYGMYLALPHIEKNTVHIHLCVGGLEYKTGKSMRMSKKDFQDLKKQMQTFQIEKYPELKHSIVNHQTGNKTKVTDKEYWFSIRNEVATDKEQLRELLDNTFASARSEKDFYTKLEEQDIELYERNGKITGVTFNDRKHRFSRLGYDEKRFEEFSVERDRLNELEALREPSRDDPSRDFDERTEYWNENERENTDVQDEKEMEFEIDMENEQDERGKTDDKDERGIEDDINDSYGTDEL